MQAGPFDAMPDEAVTFLIEQRRIRLSCAFQTVQAKQRSALAGVFHVAQSHVDALTWLLHSLKLVPGFS